MGKRILVLARRDIQLFCSGIVALLNVENSVEVRVIGEGMGRLLAVPPEFHPDLIVFFPDNSSSAAISRTINPFSPQAKLLLVFGPDVKGSLRHLLDLGADGAISSGADARELLHTVHILLVEKLKYISPLLIGTLEESSRQGWTSSLSRREMDIALFITHGKRNIEIASELNISPKTVATYKTRVYRKLGVRNAVQLLKLWQHDLPSGEMLDE